MLNNGHFIAHPVSYTHLALTAAISRVRNKIETEGRQYIKTVYGMGYMWIGGAPK